MPARHPELALTHPAYRGVRLGPADAADACPLSTDAGWNQIESDWRFLLGAGYGFGFEDAAGTLVASAVVMPYAGGLAWIGMVLVTAAARRKGLATLLMTRAIAWCREQNLIPLLDATAAGRTVYQGLEFYDVQPVTRWRGAGVTSPTTSPKRSERSAEGPERSRGTTEAFEPVGLVGGINRTSEWLAWDREQFGADRSAVLNWLLAARPDLAFAFNGPAGSPGGYCLGRSGRTATQVGPIVASRESEAIQLLQRALAGVSGAVLLDVPSGRAAFENELRQHGLEPVRELVRMRWGLGDGFGHPESVYALAGFELG